jgi:hypothetical protein
MAEKNDDQTTPTGESPVYDSLVEPPEPERVDPNAPLPDHTVEATVEPEHEHTAPAAEEPLPEEPEEIVVADSEYMNEGNKTAVIDETPVVVAKTPERASDREPVRDEQAGNTPTPPQYVYVNQPTAPVKKSNRLFGVLVGLLATVAFSIIFFIVMSIIYTSYSGSLNLGFLAQPSFYVPALFFLVGFIVLALVVNRGGWWLYVFGSILVGLFVYFGTVTAVLVANGLVLETPAAAAELYRISLSNPFTIAAALTSREVALWAGAILARRGRRVKERNSEALDEYMREKEAARRK